MNENDLQSSSEADWTRVDRVTEDENDPSETPPVDDLFFASAKLRLLKRKGVSNDVS